MNSNLKKQYLSSAICSAKNLMRIELIVLPLLFLHDPLNSCYAEVCVRIVNMIDQNHDITLRDLGDDVEKMDTVLDDTAMIQWKTSEYWFCLDSGVQKITAKCFVTNQTALDLLGLDWFEKLEQPKQITHFFDEKSPVTQVTESRASLKQAKKRNENHKKNFCEPVNKTDM
ncbi:hypothetical protein ACTXT7_002578 [Hymenolepis weldensis]